MRRMLFGISAELLSIAAYGATPASGGAPVTVQNTPLPVVLPNAPVPVSIVQIPEGMDQKTPVGVQLVGANPNIMFKEKVSAFNELATRFIGGCQASKSADFYYEDTAECLFPRPATASTHVLRAVTFTPISADTYLDDAYRAASCRSVFSYSQDGVTFKELAWATWSPGQYQPISFTLPIPIQIPAGGEYKVTTTIFHGKMNQACNTQVWRFATFN